jgi:lipoprotein-releasing system permease protein
VDPHLRIEGPNLTDSVKQALRAWPEVKAVAGVLEGIGVLRYGEQQVVVRVRGTEAGYEQVSDLSQHLIMGEGFPLRPRAVLLGAGVAARLALLDPHEERPLWLYRLSSLRALAMAGEEAIWRYRVQVQGLFSVQKDYDESWVVMRAEDLPKWREAPYTVLEVRLHRPEQVPALKQRLVRHLGPGYQIKDPKAQHADVYRVLSQEKLLAQWGLGLMLLLVAGGALSVLSALIVYHRRDWAIYEALGATSAWRRRLVGWLCLGVIGGGFVIGAFLGTLTVWSQDRFHWLKLRGGEGFLIQHFPVRLSWRDYAVLVSLLVLIGVGVYLYLSQVLRKISLRAVLQGD